MDPFAPLPDDLPPLLVGGMMGAGKSTIARIVATVTGCELVDLDAAVEAAAGKSVARIFADDGEAAFRALEAAQLERALARPGRRVVALGGGTLVDPGVRRSALARARVVTLTAQPATLASRTAGSDRPLLAGAADPADRLRAIALERAAAYAEAHACVPTENASPESVAARIIDLWRDPAVVVPLGERSYAVRVAADGPRAIAELASRLAPSSTLLVTDTRVQTLAGDAVEAALAAAGVGPAAVVAIPAGEKHKTLATVDRVLAELVASGADRDALVVGLGGGVVTDVAGFCAATLLRGVRWIAAPTTLLAMVDASVGGKTGVDVGPAKNAAGAFHQPCGVVTAPGFVATESARAYGAGLAEVVKSAAIGDVELFGWLEDNADAVLARAPAAVARVVGSSVAVKAAIVSRDERESGERAHLNFGHTVGHALESEGGYSRLLHGEAVALGMVAAVRMGVALGVTPPAAAERLIRLLGRLGLETDLDAQPIDAALPLMALDKKRRAGRLRVVLLRALGAPVVHPLALDDVRHLIAPVPG
jgi:shikimate kinase / 3-dehydroquinate synthase